MSVRENSPVRLYDDTGSMRCRLIVLICYSRVTAPVIADDRNHTFAYIRSYIRNKSVLIHSNMGICPIPLYVSSQRFAYSAKRNVCGTVIKISGLGYKLPIYIDTYPISSVRCK